MKRVLIIGASGFIGSEIYKILLKQEKIKIMVLAHNNVDYKIYEGVNLYIGSFTNINLSIMQSKVIFLCVQSTVFYPVDN